MGSLFPLFLLVSGWWDELEINYISTELNTMLD